MVTIYRPVEKLRTLAESAAIPYTDQQIIDFGLQIIKNTRDFELAIGTWNKKTSGDKTWTNFKTHFQTAQQELKEIRGPTMKQAGYHHANHLATEMRNELRNNQMEMMALVQSMQNSPNHNYDDPPDLSLIHI